MSAVMDRLRAILQKQPLDDHEYEQLVASDDAESRDASTLRDLPDETPFSRLEYAVFLLLGVAMLWAWNMFLAAAPYFAKRFQGDAWILANFQSSILSVATVTNLLSMLLLANLQASASYPRRIIAALAIDIVAFTVLALSTLLSTAAAPRAYLAFVLATVFVTSTATGLLQNGSFAFAASFGHPSYTQAIMTGQAIAGVLPSIAQIVSVLAVPQDTTASAAAAPPPQTSASAFAYFLTASFIALLTLLAFVPLVRRHAALLSTRLHSSLTTLSSTTPTSPPRKVVSMPALYRTLPLYSLAITLCFASTMLFPVFTARILSVHDPATAPPLLRPAAFIPLAFLVWNAGDLLGRLSTLLPSALAHAPRALVAAALARLLFVPLYAASNVAGRGALVNSDAFYLAVVQLGFGATNGWLASSAMMGAAAAVAEDEREAAGGFMGFNLVLGLTVGSLLSFLVAV